jgi:hypothetical protein
MAKKLIGIRQNTFQRIASGARVAFDPRSTAEVCDTRDPENYKAREEYMRKKIWEERQRDQRREAAE